MMHRQLSELTSYTWGHLVARLGPHVFPRAAQELVTEPLFQADVVVQPEGTLVISDCLLRLATKLSELNH